MLSKIAKAIKYQEYLYLSWGITNRILHLRRYIFKYYLPIFEINLKKKKYFSDLQEFKDKLKKTFGNHSGYQDSIGFETREEILEIAVKIKNGTYQIFGSEIFHEGKINWHRDFKSGFIWEKGTYYLDYIQVDMNNDADVKMPRELSRSHHLLILGQSYLLSNDEKYTQEFIDQINDWVVENPFCYSINWGCAMDVSIRAANWIFALGMFIDSPLIDEKFLKTILKSLYEHGYFVENNLEKSFKYSANHLDGDIGGLVFLGLLFKDDPKGLHWFNLSQYLLFDEIRKQVLPSGMELERATFYNRLVLEIFSYSLFLLKRNQIQIPGDIEGRIHSMYKFVTLISGSDTSLTSIGDNDSSRFLPFDKVYRNDVQYLLDIAFTYYQDSFFNETCSVSSSEVFFLLQAGKEINFPNFGIEDKTLKNKSAIFHDVGIVLMKSRRINLFVNNTSPGRFADDPFTAGSHSHADLMSIILSIEDYKVFVDPGSGVYTSDKNLRNLLRSTRMHSAVSINSLNQFLTNDDVLFDYLSAVEVLTLNFFDSPQQCLYKGQHHGYSYIYPDLVHTRQVILDKINENIFITDSITTSQNCEVQINYILNPGLKFELKEDKVLVSNYSKEIVTLQFLSEAIFNLEVSEVVYSSGYGYKQSTFRLSLVANISKTTIFDSKIEILR